jgi:DNA-binding FrmR family transcriptional regulator
MGLVFDSSRKRFESVIPVDILYPPVVCFREMEGFMDDIVTSLNRVEGQIRGIKKMYEEGRECEQIAQQIAAAQHALKRIGTHILTSEVVRCGKSQNRKDLERAIESLVKIS